MKKLISFILSLTMICCVISVPASATTIEDEKSIILTETEEGFYSPFSSSKTRNASYIIANLVEGSEDLYCDSENQFYSRAREDLYIPMKQVLIDPTDPENVENAIIDNHIQEKTAEEIRAFSAKCIEIGNTDAFVTVYIPYTSTRASGVGPYSGYGNKQYYYEETYYSDDQSGNVHEGDGGWEDYLTSGLETMLECVVDGIFDTVSKGIYSVSSSLLNSIVPSTVPASAHFTFISVLKYNKYVKNMYVYENGQYYFGCHTEKISAARFVNQLSVGGYGGGVYALPDKELGSQTMPNYTNSNAEKKAYYGYVSGGWTEYVNGYYLDGYYFDVV